MKLLLDTNVLLHWVGNTARVSQKMYELIESERNSVFYSPLSVWESRFKEGKGRLTLPANLLGVIRSKDFIELQFTSVHAERLALLPPIHGDPFDRALIAQARVEDLTLVTRDRLLSRYDVSVELV